MVKDLQMAAYLTQAVVYRGGILAGGAPRNLSLNLPVKDWDFFFAKPLGETTIAYLLGDLGIQEPIEHIGEEYEGISELEVLRVDSHVYGQMDFILTNRGLHSQIARFPDSISQCWLDSGGRIKGTPAFDRSRMYHQVVLDECPPKRELMLRELLPGWEFIVNRKFQAGVEITQPLATRQELRRAKNPDYAPNWWTLPPVTPETAARQGASAMDAVRALCGK